MSAIFSFSCSTVDPTVIAIGILRPPGPRTVRLAVALSASVIVVESSRDIRVAFSAESMCLILLEVAADDDTSTRGLRFLTTACVDSSALLKHRSLRGR